MNTKNFRHQHGWISLTKICVLLLFSSFCYYGLYPHMTREVTSDEYAALHTRALKSCAGQAFLRERVSAGPITNWDKSDVFRQLYRFETAHDVSGAKAAILGVNVTCTQSSKEQQ